MANGKIFGLIFIVSIFFSSLASAEKGEVVHYKSGCDYYIVDASMGFALLEWYGGNDPSEGDTLVGDFDGYGMKEIYNISAGSETQVWVEDYMLSKDSAIEMYYEQCK